MVAAAVITPGVAVLVRHVRLREGSDEDRGPEMGMVQF